MAATGGAWRVTHWLLHNNVDVNALDGFGRTPLDDALKAGHAEVAELLADSGGRVVVDGHMVTPGMVMKMALASGRSQRVINTDKPVVTVPPGAACACMLGGACVDGRDGLMREGCVCIACTNVVC